MCGKAQAKPVAQPGFLLQRERYGGPPPCAAPPAPGKLDHQTALDMRRPPLIVLVHAVLSRLVVFCSRYAFPPIDVRLLFPGGAAQAARRRFFWNMIHLGPPAIFPRRRRPCGLRWARQCAPSTSMAEKPPGLLLKTANIANLGSVRSRSARLLTRVPAQNRWSTAVVHRRAVGLRQMRRASASKSPSANDRLSTA